MKVALIVDEKCQEASVLVNVPKRTLFFDHLMLKIRRLLNEQQLDVQREGELFSFEISDIDRVFTDNKNVFCMVRGEKYRIRKRICELANLLPVDLFFQISQSEIVNRHFVEKFSLSKTGLYQVILKDGNVHMHQEDLCIKSRRSILNDEVF